MVGYGVGAGVGASFVGLPAKSTISGADCTLNGLPSSSTRSGGAVLLAPGDGISCSIDSNPLLPVESPGLAVKSE